jgi:hypothetical protein
MLYCLVKTKIQSYLLIALLLVLTVHQGIAQPPGYRAAVNKAINDANMHWQMNQMFHNMQYLQRSEVLTNRKYDYTVLLRDSTELAVRSRIHTDTVAKVSYLTFEDKSQSRTAAARQRKILPSETLYVSRMDRSTGAYVLGTPTDSCWLFRVEGGKISIYSLLSEVDITDDYITAIQLGEGPIEPMSEGRLREMIKGNERALMFLERKNYLRAIRKFNKEQLKGRTGAPVVNKRQSLLPTSVHKTPAPYLIAIGMIDTAECSFAGARYCKRKW